MIEVIEGNVLYRNKGTWRKHNNNGLYNLKIYNIRVVVVYMEKYNEKFLVNSLISSFIRKHDEKY